MNKKQVFIWVTLFISSITVFASKGTQERPNVIVNMTDDQGYPELSIHGNPILDTPNLDQLARTSVRFGDFHAAPMGRGSITAYQDGFLSINFNKLN